MFAFGTVLGVIYVLKTRKPEDSILKFGVFTGVIGGFFSSFFITLYEWIRFAVYYGPDVNAFLVFLGYLAVSGIMIGLIVGALVSAYFMYRGVKSERAEEKRKEYDKDRDIEVLFGTTLMRESIEELPDVICLAAEMGVDFVSTSNLIVFEERLRPQSLLYHRELANEYKSWNG